MLDGILSFIMLNVLIAYKLVKFGKILCTKFLKAYLDIIKYTIRTK